MGKKDVVQKIFWEDNERFADLFNVVLGKEKIVLKPEDLTKEETTILEVVKKENNKTFIEKYRDVIKKATTDMTCILIGIENQSEANYTMPLRVMLWDALSYQEQIRELERIHRVNGDLSSGAEYLSGIKKKDKLKPVCTIVLYYDEKEWDSARSLYEMLDWNGIPEHMKEWITDYPMILVDVFRFPEWEKFQSDLREVFGFIQSSKDKNKMKFFLENNAERFSSMADDACNLIEEVTGTKKIRQFRTEKREGKQNMCKAIDDMMKENWDAGYDEGQKNMCKAMDDMLKEKWDAGYDEGRKQEMINTERERQRAAELEREIQLLRAQPSA